jgi:hypothetical protein
MYRDTGIHGEDEAKAVGKGGLCTGRKWGSARVRRRGMSDTLPVALAVKPQARKLFILEGGGALPNRAESIWTAIPGKQQLVP